MIVNIEEFRNTEANSASRLSDLDYSPMTYKNNLEKRDEEKEASHFRFGGAVDCLLTEPSEYSKRYYLMNVQKPSETLQLVVEGVFNEVKNDIKNNPFGVEDLNTDRYEEIVLQHCAYQNYGQSWKEDTRLNKVFEGGNDYFKALLDSIGKSILSPEEDEMIRECAHILKTNEYTKHLFNSNDENIEIKYQVPIVFDYVIDGLTYKCKGLIDVLVVNHRTQTVQIIDIKTTGSSVYTFPHSYIKFRYYLQGALYYEGIKRTFDAEKYTVLYPIFVVAEQKSINAPFSYQMSHDDMIFAIKGGKTRTGKKVNGLNKLLEDLAWHKSNDRWEYPREVYEGDGKLFLKELTN